jgi:hypothetical protein
MAGMETIENGKRKNGLASREGAKTQRNTFDAINRIYRIGRKIKYQNAKMKMTR